MPRRLIVRLEIHADAKQELERVCDEMGMSQVTVSSRLVEWFTQREEMLQVMILGHYPRTIEPDVAALILKHVRPRSSASGAST